MVGIELTGDFNLTLLVGEFLFGFGTLFSIINPFGLAFIFLQRTLALSEVERRALALRIADGLVVAVAGWTMLNAPADGSGDAGGAVRDAAA